MNDLGLTMAWLAVQVALLLLPALTLHALASRRGPAGGAWVASLSLGLVVALNVAAFVPGIRFDEKPPVEAMATPAVAIGDARATVTPSELEQPCQRPASGGRSGPVPRLAAIGLGPARARCR